MIRVGFVPMNVSFNFGVASLAPQNAVALSVSPFVEVSFTAVVPWRRQAGL